jgi:sarcosine dehydrogenase
MGVLSVMGPEARKFLQPLTETDLSEESFPFATCKEISIGMSNVLALRLSYMGELGWELHVGMDQMAAVYDTLMDHGKRHPIQLAGHYAINSLRLEKGFRAWGHELSPDDNPLEAGLSFAVDWKKESGFIGQDSLVKSKSSQARKRLAIFTLNHPDVTLWGGEIIYRNGQVVGYTTSGSFGHSVGAGIAMGYVRNQEGVDRAFVLDGDYALKVGNQMVPAKVHLKAPLS